MSATWRLRGSGGPDDDLAAETLACVERTPYRVTMEWRREMRDGRRDRCRATARVPVPVPAPQRPNPCADNDMCPGRPQGMRNDHFWER
jgi:hypothetical protein